MGLVVEGTLGRNNALRLADAKKASALRVSVICYFISELPCDSPRLAFATHSRSMPRQASTAAKSAASSSLHVIIIQYSESNQIGKSL